MNQMTIPELFAAGLGPKCANPLCGRPIPPASRPRYRGGWTWYRYRDGLCNTCHKRWKRLGYPEAGPGAPYKAKGFTAEGLERQRARLKAAREGRIEDAVWLADEVGLTDEQIADRLGVKIKTVGDYLREGGSLARERQLRRNTLVRDGYPRRRR